jgi:hypothetical protein
MEFNYNVGDKYIMLYEDENEINQWMDCEIIFKNPDVNSFDGGELFYLVKINDRKNKKNWEEWLCYGDLDEMCRALIDETSFNKVFRERKLERILDEQE